MKYFYFIFFWIFQKIGITINFAEFASRFSFLLYIVITLIVTSISSQLFKLYLNNYLTGKKNKLTLTSDGDFPSSHTATVFSAVMIAFFYMINQNLSDSSIMIFAMFGLYSAFVIKDALGVRMTVQKHGTSIRNIAKLNSIAIKSLPDNIFSDSDIEDFLKNSIEEKEEKTPIKDSIQRRFDLINDYLNFKSGHLPHEVIGGAFWGFLISSITSSIYYKRFEISIFFILVTFIYIHIMRLFLKKKNEKDS